MERVEFIRSFGPQNIIMISLHKALLLIYFFIYLFPFIAFLSPVSLLISNDFHVFKVPVVNMYVYFLRKHFYYM